MDTSFLLEMDRKQLQELRKDIDKQFEKIEATRKQEALAALKKVEEEFGYSIDELKGGGRSGKSTKGVPKYANPDDADKTWTGRGRKPQWVVDHLENGGSLSDLEIK